MGPSMKQHAGDEIRVLMTEMPPDLVQALQSEHPEHRITEQEARWWGYLMFARTGAYDGVEFVIKVNGTDETVVQGFLSYTLSTRAAAERAGLVRKPWPESGFDPLR